MKIVTFYLLSVTSALVTNLKGAKNYLQRYGYTTNNFLTNFESLLVNFQKRYKINANGKLNDETLELMNRARCIQPENNFAVATGWNKTHLKWFFPQAGKAHIKLTKRAFKIWEESSILKFSHLKWTKKIKPDITISVQKTTHSFLSICQGRDVCPYKFDGLGIVLAHSYFPQENQCREIHMDADEKWYFGIDGNVPPGYSSFLLTLAHEIGHVLGLRHNNDESSIMFPWYKNNFTSLSSNDKSAIEYLYGNQSGKKSIQPTFKRNFSQKCSINLFFVNFNKNF